MGSVSSSNSFPAFYTNETVMFFNFKFFPEMAVIPEVIQDQESLL